MYLIAGRARPQVSLGTNACKNAAKQGRRAHFSAGRADAGEFKGYFADLYAFNVLLN